MAGAIQSSRQYRPSVNGSPGAQNLHARDRPTASPAVLIPAGPARRHADHVAHVVAAHSSDAQREPVTEAHDIKCHQRHALKHWLVIDPGSEVTGQPAASRDHLADLMQGAV